MKPLPDKDQRDGSTVLARQFGDCQSDAAVVLLTVEGGGHLPPGADIGNRPLLRSILGGPANQDISAADVSWKFFKRFPLPPN
jgi:poly(3-hydroxybutyrate) depolymerase